MSLPKPFHDGHGAPSDATTKTYWRGAAHDEAMQDEHAFVWNTMLETIDVDLAGTRVLDAGCNGGAFLRRLADESDLAEGFGYDPASGAIHDARRLAGGRPPHFETADTVPARWSGFDVAFGHQPTPRRRVGQDCRTASRSALIVSASVVGMPCGNPLYVFSVPFCTSCADSGAESA
jgi:hypothetical protein